MARTEISLFLKNAPGTLGKLTERFAQAGININYVYGSVAGNDHQGPAPIGYNVD